MTLVRCRLWLLLVVINVVRVLDVDTFLVRCVKLLGTHCGPVHDRAVTVFNGGRMLGMMVFMVRNPSVMVMF